MELLTGQPALSRDANPGNDQYIEHRSLVEYVSPHQIPMFCRIATRY